MKIQTTVVNRANTNTSVIEAAQGHMKEGKEIRLFSEFYEKHQIRLLGHIMRLNDDENDKKTTLETGGTPYPRLNPNRRVGKPRMNWAEEATKTAWIKHHQYVEEDDDHLGVRHMAHIQALNIVAFAGVI